MSKHAVDESEKTHMPTNASTMHHVELVCKLVQTTCEVSDKESSKHDYTRIPRQIAENIRAVRRNATTKLLQL